MSRPKAGFVFLVLTQKLYKKKCVIFQYQLDTEQLSDTLTKLNNNLDPKTISKKGNSETLLQLEVQENQWSPDSRPGLYIQQMEGGEKKERQGGGGTQVMEYRLRIWMWVYLCSITTL